MKSLSSHYNDFNIGSQWCVIVSRGFAQIRWTVWFINGRINRSLLYLFITEKDRGKAYSYVEESATSATVSSGAEDVREEEEEEQQSVDEQGEDDDMNEEEEEINEMETEMLDLLNPTEDL